VQESIGIRRWLRTATITALVGAMAAAQAGPPEGPPGEHGHHGPPPGAAPRGQYWDGVHGHARYYPAPGFVVHAPPPRAGIVVWGGTRYAFHEGIWYAPATHGYVVVRPPYGVVVPVLPVFATAVVIGGLSYMYCNSVYYRAVPTGGYEVVAPPVGVPGEPVPPPLAPAKVFVYPRQGQSAEQQATDEYECHRWAVNQSGFDPTASATGSGSTDPVRRADYGRARSACLDGRGYTVR